MPLVELQNFLNDLVSDSPYLGRARSAPTHADNPKLDDLLRSVLLRVKKSRALNDFIAVKNLG
jgi:hypothetical protein